MASSDHTNKPTAREINLAAEIKRMWGPEWNKPSEAYRFEDRLFYLRTEDSGIYQNVGYMVDGYIVDQPDYVRNEGV